MTFANLFLLAVCITYTFVESVVIPEITNHVKDNENSYSLEETPNHDSSHENYQSQTYTKSVTTTVPNCYEFKEESLKEKIERYMCEMDNFMYVYKHSKNDVDPAWLSWNSRNPLSHEPAHCQNIAFHQEKRIACTYFENHFDHYENAIQQIIGFYFRMGPEYIKNVHMDDFYSEMENAFGLPTIGLQEEIVYLMFQVINDYHTQHNDIDNYSAIYDGTNDDGEKFHALNGEASLNDYRFNPNHI